MSDEEFKALADSTAENDASELRSYDPTSSTQATPGK